MEKLVLPNDVMLDEVVRLLDEGREVVMVPKGKSMLPFIRGEVDKVVLVKTETYKVGDVVLAHFGERYLLHRIIAIEGEQVTLMGDGNLRGIEVGPKASIAGKVIAVIAPSGRQRSPRRGWLWRKLLPFRKYLLKIYRKWNKIFGKRY